MTGFVFAQQLITIIASTIAILIAIISFILWIAKHQFRKGEFYQLFKSLGQEVKYIREMVQTKFNDSDSKHNNHFKIIQTHDKRITKLEVINDVKKDT